MFHNYIAFVAFDDGDLYRLRADGSDFTRLTTTLQFSSAPLPISPPVLSPNGTWLALIAEPHTASALFIIRPDGRELRRLTHGVSGAKFNPYWSPDSRYLVFGNENPSWNATYYLVEVESGSVTRLRYNPTFPLQPWQPEPWETFPPTVTPRDLEFLNPWWMRSNHIFTFPDPVGIASNEGWVSDSPRLLVRQLATGTYYLLDTHGQNPMPWAPAVPTLKMVGVHPQGQMVCYASLKDATLYLHPLNGADPIVIQHHYPDPVVFDTPHWSPDGRHLAYVLNHKLRYYVHLTTIATGSTHCLGEGLTPRWLPNSASLTYLRLTQNTHPYPAHPVRYDLATATTTPLLNHSAPMEISAWHDERQLIMDN
jgi:hypothetical protein